MTLNAQMGTADSSRYQESRIRRCNRMQIKRKLAAVAGQGEDALKTRDSARLCARKHIKEGGVA